MRTWSGSRRLNLDRERDYTQSTTDVRCVRACVRVCVCMLHAYVYVCMPMCSYTNTLGIAHVYILSLCIVHHTMALSNVRTVLFIALCKLHPLTLCCVADTGATAVGDGEWGHLQIDATSLYLLTLAQDSLWYGQYRHGETDSATRMLATSLSPLEH